MIEFLTKYQLNLMMILSGICGTIALFVMITRTMSRKRKGILLNLELGSMALLMADRYAYIYRGNETDLGYWMVRISNFCVFALTLLVVFFFNQYLKDLYEKEGGLTKRPWRLFCCDVLCLFGFTLVVLSQFYGFYYTFDATNHYQRGPWFVLCYLIPILALLLQMSVIIQYYENLNRGIRLSLILFTSVPLIASVVQFFVYGISFTNISIVGVAVLLYVFAINDMNQTVERAKNMEIQILKDEQKNMQQVFEQTAEALASAIDAKDPYTHGHSMRVAEYSKKIAAMSGKSEKECDEVYYAALLHDVGKIGVPDEIITKEGKLTAEEFAKIKEHPVIGKRILSSIQKLPYLSIGANSHHERYDGRGYPEGLKGKDIPEIARIIAVADAYDAMTSKRSYRDPLPQQKVREELVKGMETQFDPEFAKKMLHLIDLDEEYEMKEREEVKEFSGSNQIHSEKLRSAISEGVLVNETPTHMRIRVLSGEASLLLFDSLDARAHADDGKKEEMIYFEYGVIHLNGTWECLGARKMEGRVTKKAASKKEKAYDVQVVRWEDHVRVTISGPEEDAEVIVALPDSVRYAYLGVTGERCSAVIEEINKLDAPISEKDIPRIAERISYIDVPEGDIPNIQVNGWRMVASKGIPVKDKLKVRFHAMSLPTARLVWHCPFISIYTSKDGIMNGEGFREFALIRMDGECWEADAHAVNKLQINKTEDFQGWDVWKEQNKKGVDIEVSIRRNGNEVSIWTEDCGISIRNLTTINDAVDEVYFALTGDQCAITGIKILE